MINGWKPQKIFELSLKEVLGCANDVLDIGTSQRFAKELRQYEILFSGKNYTAAGYKPTQTYGRYNCNCHQDIHNMSFEANSFDVVLCIEVIEHIDNPIAAINEIFRVLRPNGRLFLTAPFLTQYHGRVREKNNPDHQNYPDFWRFTHQGLEKLLAHFNRIKIIPIDGPIEFRLKQLIPVPMIHFFPIRKIVDLIDRPMIAKATTRHIVLAVK